MNLYNSRGSDEAPTSEHFGKKTFAQSCGGLWGKIKSLAKGFRFLRQNRPLTSGKPVCAKPRLSAISIALHTSVVSSPLKATGAWTTLPSYCCTRIGTEDSGGTETRKEMLNRADYIMDDDLAFAQMFPSRASRPPTSCASKCTFLRHAKKSPMKTEMESSQC